MFINLSFNNPKSTDIFNDIFKSQLDRGIIPGEYNSYFCRYLGISNEESYNNQLALLKKKENNQLKIIEFPINIINNMDISIDDKINIYGIEFYKYINIFEDSTLNFRGYKALDFIASILTKSNIILDKQIEIIKYIIFTGKEFVVNIEWNELDTAKYIFYGDSSQVDNYLMLFLKLLGCDVVYLNPKKIDISIDDIDLYSFKIVEKESSTNLTYNQRVSKGKVILEYKTIGKEAEYELEKEIFNEETGFYKPWQFINYDTESVLINSTFDEVMVYYNENANVRPGFKISNNVVSIPNFFTVITGINNDIDEFGNFLRVIFNRENVLVLDNIALYNYPITYKEAISYSSCFNEEGIIVEEKVKFHMAENRFKKYRIGLKNLFIKKINEILENSYIISTNFSENDKIEYFATIMTMPEEFYQLIDSFDYTGRVPKITIYRDNNQSLSIRELYVLIFLNSIGIDIILYSGFGTYGIEKWTNRNSITYHRLEKIDYNLNLESAMKIYKKRGFFSKLFKK